MKAKCTCGASSIRLTAGDVYARGCLDTTCGTTGPWRDTDDDAVDAWNTLVAEPAAEPSVTWTTKLSQRAEHIDVFDVNGNQCTTYDTERFGPLAHTLQSGPRVLEIRVKRVEAEPREGRCEVCGVSATTGVQDYTQVEADSILTRKPLGDPHLFCGDHVRESETVDITSSMPVPPEEPTEPRRRSRSRPMAHQTSGEPLGEQMAALRHANSHSREQEMAIHKRIDELVAGVMLHQNSRSAHDLAALHERISELESTLADHLTPPEPTPDDEPDCPSDCPSDCRMVEFQGADGDRLFSHPIADDFRPTYVESGSMMFRLELSDGCPLYQAITPNARVYRDEPLRPESPDD